MLSADNIRTNIMEVVPVSTGIAPMMPLAA